MDAFKGAIIVHKGKPSTRMETTLYQVHENAVGIHIVEVQATSTSLNSNDSFVLVTPSTVFIWVGSVCKPPTKEAAEKSLAHLQVPKVTNYLLSGDREAKTL